MLKSNTSDFYFHKYVNFKINLDDDVPWKKTLNMYNVVIHINSVFNKNHNHYYYQTFI